MDLVKSLPIDQLIEGFQSGQIREELEVAFALAEVAKTDPKRALALVAEIPGRSSHDRARRAVIEEWVKTDAEEVLAYILSLPPQAYQRQLARDLVWAWRDHDPEAALTKLAEIESLVDPREKLVESIVTEWAEDDYEAAAHWIRNTAPKKKRDAMQMALIEGKLAKLHGEEAVSFLLDQPDSESLTPLLSKAFHSWTFSQPEDAIGRFVSMPKEHPIWEEVRWLGSETMTSLLHRDPTNLNKILELKDLIPEGEARTQFLLGAANLASSNDIPTAKRIIAEIPESRERVNAVGMFTELWMRKDHVGLSEWLSTLEPSPSRDAAVSRFVNLLAKSDPERASEWAETISNERQRARAIEDVAK